MRLVLALLVLPCALLPRSSAAVRIVDPTRRLGPYRTIGEAIGVARDGDTILIVPEHYDEKLTIRGKALTILGLGQTPKGVVIGDRLFDQREPPILTIENHPAGKTTRIGRLFLGSSFTSVLGDPFGVRVQSGAGTIVFDEVQSTQPWEAIDFGGTLSITRCSGISNEMRASPSTPAGLNLTRVALAIVQQSEFRSRIPGPVKVAWNGAPGAIAIQSTLEFHGSTITGGPEQWDLSTQLAGDAGHGLMAWDALVRVTGNAQHFIAGGGQRTTGGGHGGSAVVLTRSTLEYSGATLRPGLATFVDPMIQKDAKSVVTRVTPATPFLSREPPVRFGRATVLDLFAEPGRASVTLLCFRLGYTQLPIGALHVDPGSLLVPLPAVTDSVGHASVSFTMSGAPGDLIGQVVALQSLVLDPVLGLRLSGPASGIVLW